MIEESIKINFNKEKNIYSGVYDREGVSTFLIGKTLESILCKIIHLSGSTYQPQKEI
jgi:hypothetical protein